MAGTRRIGHRAPVYGQRAYWQRIKAVYGSSLVAYWPLSEAAGTLAHDMGGAGYNGTHTNGPTPGQAGPAGDRRLAVLYNGGAGEHTNVHSAGLAAAYNGNEFTISSWTKIAAAPWADATNRYIWTFFVDANNQVYARKGSSANTFVFVRITGTKTAIITVPTAGNLEAFHVALTCSAAADKLVGYYNGEPVGAPVNAIGNFVGALAATNTVLGNLGTGANFGYKGLVQHVALGNQALKSADIAVLARKNGHVYFDGDSRTLGSTSPYPTQCMAAAGVKALKYGWENLGVSGETLVQMIANTPAKIARRPALPKQVVVAWAGINDAHAGATAAEMHDRLRTYCLARRAEGFKVIACTEIDDQSTFGAAVSWNSTLWAATNTAIKADWTEWSDAQVDLGANAALQNATNTTYYNADKLHLTDAGYAVVAGLVATAVAGV